MTLNKEDFEKFDYMMKHPDIEQISKNREMIKNFEEECMKDGKILLPPEILKDLGVIDEDEPEELSLLEEVRQITKDSIKEELRTLKERIRKGCTQDVYKYAKKGKDFANCIFEGPFFDYPKKYKKIYEEEVEYWRKQGFYAVLKERSYDYPLRETVVDRVEIKISWEKGTEKDTAEESFKKEYECVWKKEEDTENE